MEKIDNMKKQVIVYVKIVYMDVLRKNQKKILEIKISVKGIILPFLKMWYTAFGGNQALHGNHKKSTLKTHAWEVVV